MALARARLTEERKNWRKDHPHGFVAKPVTAADGSIDMLTWSCIVPGKEKTYVEGGMFPVTIKFSESYPSKPPGVYMPRGFFHVNVFENGGVCLSILKESVPDHLGRVSGWSPSVTVKQILLCIQELLHNPNFGSVASWDAYHTQKRSPAEYEKRMRAQTAKYTGMI